MRKLRPGSIQSIAVLALCASTMFFLGCQQSRNEVNAMGPPPGPSATESVSIVFAGPWAFAPDPKDANKILLIAPKTKSHHDLYVSASNNVTLDAGVYDFSLPAAPVQGTPSADPDFAEAKTTAADLQRITDTKAARYVIRLPKPEAYRSAGRFRSRVDSKYPPDPSTEKDYVTEISLRYSVSSLNGFSLSGAPDSGSFNPKLMHIESGMVTFMIVPLESFNPAEKCHTHAREAFRDLTQLLKLSLYIDFPDSPDKCRDSDPQKSAAPMRSGDWKSSGELRALLDGNVADVQQAGFLPTLPARAWFALNPAICTGAVIKLNVGESPK